MTGEADVSPPSVESFDSNLHPTDDFITVSAAQLRLPKDAFVSRQGFSYLKATTKRSVTKKIRHYLSLARENNAKVLCFPELSHVTECAQEMASFSQDTEAVVIGGTHYRDSKNVCPVWIAGKSHVVEKVSPSYFERSPVAGKTLVPGSHLSVFKNTPIGTFAVLICSDFDVIQNRSAVYSYKPKPDFVFVISFNPQSPKFHQDMSSDCQREGIYFVYVNAICPGMADGQSSIFAVMERSFMSKIPGWKEESAYRCRVWNMEDKEDLFVARMNIAAKLPQIPHSTPRTIPNVEIVRPDLSKEFRYLEQTEAATDLRVHEKAIMAFLSPHKGSTFQTVNNQLISENFDLPTLVVNLHSLKAKNLLGWKGSLRPQTRIKVTIRRKVLSP